MKKEPFLDPTSVKESFIATSLPEQAYHLIKKAIVSGHIKSGVWLRQRDLAQELGVGTSTVREALKRLAAEGFVTVEPYKGIRTNIPTPEYMLDHGQVLNQLEQMAIKLAAEHITQDQLARLGDLLPLTIPGSDDISVATKADHDFHSIIFQASGREYLAQLLEQTWEKYHSVGILLLYREDDLQDWMVSVAYFHPKILEALKARDGDLAASYCAQMWDTDIKRDQRVFNRNWNQKDE